MTKDKGRRILSLLLTVLLMTALSFNAVFAGTEQNSGESTDANELTTYVTERDGQLYFLDASTGDIVKKAGFVKDLDGKMYYIRKGIIGVNRWTIVTNKTFKVGSKYYRAAKSGALKTGVYKWSGKYYYSKPSTGEWIKKEKIVTWKGNKYYIQSGGDILTDGIFTYKDVPYKSDARGKIKEIVVPKTSNKVIRIAREQVGILTGKTYWVWYFKTKFIDTDRTPWCGAFVAWVYNKAGLYDKVLVATKFGNLGYVPTYSKYANKYGKWVKTKKAKAGDIIVFGSNQHVGLVEGVADGCIVTIEGNAGPTAIIGCGKAGAVVRKVYDLKSTRIKGVIRVL
ncbi:MAG: CHAP domain-containing protein [Mogibacterium sp.]|nr:CHAP domain-containing protein [Mogibacterium sp.]